MDIRRRQAGTGEAPEEHRNIGRLTAILSALAGAGGEGMRFTDLVAATGLGKATAHRILGGLRSAGLVDHDEDSGRFFVGLTMLAWASAAKARFDVVRLVEPAMTRLVRQTQDTVYLVARTGDEIVCLDAVEGSFPIRVLTLAIGDRRPLGIGAGSLAILAALPDEEVERILAAHAAERAAFPFDDQRLREMIGEARANGYAYNNVHLFKGLENTTDMAGIGVAIRRPDGQPVAALHITAVTSRLEPPRRESVVASLKREAALIEADYAPLLATMRGAPARRRL